MRFDLRRNRFLIGAFLMATMLFTSIPLRAQDFVQVADITGGSSVFVVRSSNRSPRKYTPQPASRSRAQKQETAKRIRRQHDNYARSAPRTGRADVVAPDKLPPNIKTMEPAKASLLFAGVGEYFVERNDLENSLNFFRESLELDPNNLKAKMGLAIALSMMGNSLLAKDQLAGAKSYFLEALKNYPQNSAAFIGLGQIYTEQTKDDEAISSYESALKENAGLTEIYAPLGILYFQKGEIAKADEMLTKAVAASLGDAETQLFIGMIRARQNRNTEAMDSFERARSSDATLAEAPYNIAETMVRLGRHKDSVAEYNKAIALKPSYFDAWYGLGDTHVVLKDHAAAVVAYKEAKRLKNDNIDVLIALGDAQRLNGQLNDAAGTYSLAATLISRRPDFNKDFAADVYSKIGLMIGLQCEINIRKAIACDWPSAISALEKALELGGERGADYANLGWAYYNAAIIDGYDKREADKKTKLQLARVHLEKAISLDSKFAAGPMLNLGRILIDLGDFAGAANVLSQAVSREPKWTIAVNELGIAYRKQNKFKEAISWFKQAVELDDNFEAGQFNLAESEIKNGNIGNAKKPYEKLKKMGRNDFAGLLELMTNGAIKK